VELHLHSPSMPSWRGAQLKKLTNNFNVMRIKGPYHTFSICQIADLAACWGVYLYLSFRPTVEALSPFQGFAGCHVILTGLIDT
jgi:hypothetical protein